ncbi:uncharacterized protein [Aegilops tauschii subsp. strangulata]|uniref:uncharacterized protein n=1 Tax=Aegilops tauschii subsp. strangulata TaxID=200361 RepID=UPI003CC8677C
MATAKSRDGGAADARCGADGDPPEFRGGSNPSQSQLPPQLSEANTSVESVAATAFARAVKEDPTGSQNWASAFGGVCLNDEVWEVRFHFFDRDNLERNISLSDITFWNLVALVEVEGYSFWNPGVWVSGMIELTDDDKVEEMLGELASKEKKVVNVTVMRSDAPTPADLNRCNVYEDQVPLSEIGVTLVYEIDTSGVLFPRTMKPQPQPVQVMHTHDSIEPEFVVDNGEERHEYFVDIDQEQEQIEQKLEENRNKEIEKFRSNKKRKEKYRAAKRKLPELLAEDCTDNDTDSEILVDENIIARLEAMKRHRDDPLNHFEDDTDVEELYEPDEEEGVDKATEKEAAVNSSIGGSSTGGSQTKGPTTRSHASLDQII